MTSTQIATMIEKAVAAALAKGKPVSASVAQRKRQHQPEKRTWKASEFTPSERKENFAKAVVETFTKAGYTNVVPNETILTYGKWAERGFRVKKGEKSVRVKTGRGSGIPLFHVSQVEPINGSAKPAQPALPAPQPEAQQAEGWVEASA